MSTQKIRRHQQVINTYQHYAYMHHTIPPVSACCIL